MTTKMLHPGQDHGGFGAYSRNTGYEEGLNPQWGMFWKVGGDRRNRRKPTQTQEEHVKLHIQ